MPGTVLYVDDDRGLCQIVAKALRGEGYTAVTAFDGEEAVEAVQAEQPDLVLLDLILPRRDGFEVLSEIRGLEMPSRETPVVILTGCSATPAYAERANSLRAADLLTKPVPLDRLLEVVARHVGEAKEAIPASAREPIRPRPRSVSGSFERIPFPAVLHHLHGLRATGVLQLACGKKRKWIQLRDGYPVAVRSNLVRETLGRFLAASGRISSEVEEESRRRMSDDRRQGEILVAMNELSEEEVAEVLRQQADEKLFEVFSWESGTFRFERGGTLRRANTLGIGRSPANLVLHGVRTHFPIERIDRYLRLHEQRCIARAESPFYRFQEIDIDPEQHELLEGLDGRRRAGEFLDAPEPLRRTLYALIATGMLELCDSKPAELEAAAEPSAASQERAPEPAPPAPTEAEAERPPRAAVPKPRSSGGAATPADLVRLAEQLRGCNYFEILGVRENVGAAELSEAYERLSARTHPDRFSGGGESARDLAAELFEQVTEAYETLSNPHRRQSYLLDCQSQQREQAKRQRAELALEAESEFQRGQAALNSREYEMAMLHFGRALQLYPDEGDHHAHYGWALHLCHPGDPAMVGEAIEHVKRGLKLASHREKPYLFMGRLYRAIGRADTAEKMFTRAVQIQPECVEALRELRLINMRREKSKGLIGRLFRR